MFIDNCKTFESVTSNDDVEQFKSKHRESNIIPSKQPALEFIVTKQDFDISRKDTS